MTSTEVVNLNNCRVIRRINLKNYKYVALIEISTNKIYLQIIFNKKCQSPQEENELMTRFTNISKISSHPSLVNIIDFRIVNSYPTILADYPSNGYLTNEKNDPLKFNDKGFIGTKKLISLIGIAAGMLFYYSNQINHGNLKKTDIFFDKDLYPHVLNCETAQDTSEENEFTRKFKAQTHDIQSFGHIAYEIITSTQSLPQNSTDNPPDLSQIKSEWMQQFLQSCFSSESYSNPTFDHIFNELVINRSKYQQIFGKIDENEVTKYIETINHFLIKFTKPNLDNPQPRGNSSTHTFEGIFGLTAKIGEKAPYFKGQAVLPTLEFSEVELTQYKGKWLVLFTYPLDFTFVCPTEIIQFSEEYDHFTEINCDVVGISVDSVYTHLAWLSVPRNQGGIQNIRYPIIGDLGGVISKMFGFYLYEEGHDLRGTAIIDPDGVVRHISMNHPDVGRNVDEVLRLVQGYQFAREHGEVCPAQWHAGDDAIKPDPKGSLEYFSKQ